MNQSSPKQWLPTAAFLLVAVLLILALRLMLPELDFLSPLADIGKHAERDTALQTEIDAVYPRVIEKCRIAQLVCDGRISEADAVTHFCRLNQEESEEGIKHASAELRRFLDETCPSRPE